MPVAGFWSEGGLNVDGIQQMTDDVMGRARFLRSALLAVACVPQEGAEGQVGLDATLADLVRQLRPADQATACEIMRLLAVDNVGSSRL